MADPFSDSNPLTTGPPYDPEKDREKVRGRITFSTLICFCLIVISYGFVSWQVREEAQWNRIKEAMGSIFPAVTSIVGSVIGFYFGAQKK